MRQKFNYFLASAKKGLTGQGSTCPSCGNPQSELISRKYIVTALRRCQKCQLQFRAPTGTSEENESYYQEAYSQGFTTDCPSDAALAELMKNRFAGGEKDYSDYINVVCAAGGREGDRLFDFGCSWGYGSWQFRQFGFAVESYEISRPRAQFAREKLGVMVHGSLDQVSGDFDIFFSAHVLEHVPSVRDSISFGLKLLKPGGLFVTFTPNGSETYRRENFESWNKLWGEVHCNFLDEKFYRHTFAGHPLLLSGRPFDLKAMQAWTNSPSTSPVQMALAGSELLILAKK